MIVVLSAMPTTPSAGRSAQLSTTLRTTLAIPIFMLKTVSRWTTNTVDSVIEQSIAGAARRRIPNTWPVSSSASDGYAPPW